MAEVSGKLVFGPTKSHAERASPSRNHFSTNSSNIWRPTSLFRCGEACMASCGVARPPLLEGATVI
jgi:hypothetical protein